MIGLLQRVNHASVEVENQIIARISRGILVLLGVEREDRPANAERLIQRILTYRIFPDAQGKMNCSLSDIQGGLLLVPQFTLAADTKKGTRPGFSTAAGPAEAEKLFDYAVERAKAVHPVVECGRFGADMQVSLTNNGPVTFWLQT